MRTTYSPFPQRLQEFYQHVCRRHLPPPPLSHLRLAPSRRSKRLLMAIALFPSLLESACHGDSAWMLFFWSKEILCNGNADI
ncbi:hypothetical protein HOY80DRAFT_1138342 [Tuber brumale]|nr:hypothetical protein HOY80DRAFT_1138342 [Tuber brumale]